MRRATPRIVATGFAAALAFGSLAACSDEDGDGATTDEEIQDVEEGVDDAGNQVEEEVEGQDEGSNEDGE
jgi:hypothetical protein